MVTNIVFQANNKTESKHMQIGIFGEWEKDYIKIPHLFLIYNAILVNILVKYIPQCISFTLHFSFINSLTIIIK